MYQLNTQKMIKHKLLLGLALMFAFLLACEDEPGDYFDYEKAFTQITFENYPGYTASFTSLDNVQLTVNSSNESVNQIQVFRNAYTAGGSTVADRDLVGTVNVSGGQGTLDLSLEEILAGTGASPESLSNVALDFVAEQDGQTTFKRFQVNVTPPLTFEGPETGFSDSAVVFTYGAATGNETISNIEFFTRTGDEEFAATPDESVDINGLAGGGEFEFNLPGEQDAPVGSTVTVRSRITTAQGRTFTVDRQVRVSAVPLGEAQEATLTADQEGFSFTDQEEVAAADADIRLAIQGDLVESDRLVLRVGENSKTEFVRASEELVFEDANFQQIRDEFEAGETMNEINLSTAPTGAVYIVRLGGVPDDPSADSRRYAVMRVVDMNIADPLSDSTVTIEYRVKGEGEPAE